MKQALLVIDMLYDFVDPDGILYTGEHVNTVIEKVREEIDKAREVGIPVIYIADHHRPDDAEFVMFPAHCVAGTRGGEVIARLAPAPGDPVIHKRRYSAFFGTDLDLILREKGIEELILTGVCTNICVLYTAADARMRGYQVRVIKDAVASFDREAHEFALREMSKTLGARIE